MKRYLHTKHVSGQDIKIDLDRIEGWKPLRQDARTSWTAHGPTVMVYMRSGKEWHLQMNEEELLALLDRRVTFVLIDKDGEAE